MKMTTVYKGTYKMVEAHMDKYGNKFIRNAQKFIKDRIQDMNDVVPCSRIAHTDKQKAEFWKETGFNENDFKNAIANTYYGNLPAIKPLAAKDPLSVCLIHIVRYYYLKKKKKELDIALTYLAFSGYFYPYVHYKSYNFPPARHTMEYVVNNKLSYKYDLKKYGTVLKAVKSLTDTWIDTYKDRFDNWNDDDVHYLMDQLVDRLGSFTKNIATVFYNTHDSKEFLAYSSDSMDDENYRVADSNILIAQREIANAINYITTNQVNYTICKAAANPNVKIQQVRNLIQIILDDKKNIPYIKEMVSIIVTEFYKDNPSGTVSSAKFIVYSIKPRPNTTNKQILRLKEIQEIFLKQSEEYLKRMKRKATQISYVKALQTYITYCIYTANVNR